MTEQHEAPGGVSGRALRPGDGPDGVGARSLQKDIPQATVTRLATYLRVLATLAEDGVLIVSSEELAVAAGVNSAKLRKDLSFLGPNGVRGVGYDVAKLRTRIEDVLGLSGGHRVVLVGAGNLGRALVGYGGFRRRGFTVVGVFDADPAVIGAPLAGLTVRDAAGLRAAVAELEPTIAVIAVPDEAAQDVCDQLVAAGLQSILSFAACGLIAPDTVEVRRVDLAVEMQMLSFERTRNAEPEPLPEVAHVGSGRIARRAPAHPALKHSTSHSATEPKGKGSVVTP
ncbi:redox-sensing transcriptional repressor Rex [Nocardia puris]|uniref:Redox-sensing transcriptional repressor Rex n=1 Tax=Nocardia puris TaxID=208602 RepID=A0A366DL15_9NOCA|nr:redox-sensing transcriptional repressor Rex [Nocardia puris]MBF6211379.1 redox-sensing transcriptional repressor Rex [Nocardia puris]MBF6365097.1 redox-sensing transcriptional repressor Rex [Nocardia puris]MBF6458882.1 redox-sensing transcriptional repressor Rex [Nocardia puris]RBO90736.1 redox-sensing transcriptional repressor [Nocardia puris]